MPQEGHLFAGTVAENLRFGRPEASDAEIRAAADAMGRSASWKRSPQILGFPIPQRLVATS